MSLDRAALRRRLALPGVRGPDTGGPEGDWSAHGGASGVRIRGDHDLEPDLHPEGPLRAAAVLVPLVDHDTGATVILTQRTTHLAAHAGQISFPGGALEAGDADEQAAALREAEEEIGLAPSRVEVVGRLDTYITRTGFRVVPYVGVIDPPVELRPHPYEVADVFEVPLAFFLEADSLQRESRMFLGRQRWFYVFPYRERYIWGATAGMLRNLREVLGGAGAASGRPAP